MDNVAQDPIRLYLSGGGHRATTGSMGAVAYLLHSERWADVHEVISVSGGSIANAVLATSGDSDDETWDGVSAAVKLMAKDRGRVWATQRRAIIAALASLSALGILALLVVMLLPVGPEPPRVLVFIAGLVLVPILFRLVGSTAVALSRDFIARLSSGNGVPLRSDSSRRTHIFCTSGLSSGTPHYLWTGKSLDTNAIGSWGVDLQQPYDVADAAMASVSLPSLGRIRTPRDSSDDRLLDGGEVLVDGGVSGIFGDQVGERFRRTPADTMRSDRPTLVAVDAGRHTTSPGVLSRRLSRFSTAAVLMSWLKASLEASYVNDLLDLAPDHLARCCESDEPFDVGDELIDGISPLLALRLGATAAAKTDPEVQLRLQELRLEVAKLSLMNLNEARVSLGVTVGFAATMQSIEPYCTMNDVTVALAATEARLGLDQQLTRTWAAAN